MACTGCTDLISRKALVKAILAERDKITLTVVTRYGFGVPEPDRHGQAMRGGIRKALHQVEIAPAVDAVELVRCKDCKHFKWGDYCTQDKMEHSKCRPDDYCSYGIRRKKKDAVD